MSIKETPCRFCESRKVGCHTNCEKYTEWKEELVKHNEKIREARRAEYMIVTHSRNQNKRRK